MTYRPFIEADMLIAEIKAMPNTADKKILCQWLAIELNDEMEREGIYPLLRPI